MSDLFEKLVRQRAARGRDDQSRYFGWRTVEQRPELLKRSSEGYLGSTRVRRAGESQNTTSDWESLLRQQPSRQ